MAKDSFKVGDTPLNTEGMDDNRPMPDKATLYGARGLVFATQRYLQRCNGKQLISKFPSPILQIHGDVRGNIFVETATTIYLFNEGSPIAHP